MKNTIDYYFDKLLQKDISIEEYSDDAFCYRLFYEMYNKPPRVMYFFDGVDEEDDISGEFDLPATEENIIKNCECEVYNWKGTKIIFGKNWIEFKGVIYNINDQRPDELSQCIEITKQDTANLIFVSVSSKGGFVRKLLPVNEVDIDYDINYNADFPHERIEEIINEDKSALILNFGIPGTGNDIFIRYI